MRCIKIRTKKASNLHNITNENEDILRMIHTPNLTRRIRTRLLVVHSYINGTEKEAIAKMLCISKKSVKKYIDTYKNNGVNELLEGNPYRPKSELEHYKDAIKKDLEENPCATINECVERIKQLTGLKRSPTQVTVFMKKMGFKHLKTGQIPSKANPVKQREFLENDLEPKLEEARTGERKIFFVDASHFVMGVFLTCLWSISRIFVRSSSGRQRFNVLGALDPFSQELITITNDSYINSDSVCELLRKTHEVYKNKSIKITMVMDNARYQRCKKVIELAEELKIELLFLPTYSPNLNLIERLWKFVKKECLYAQYYDTFDKFKENIEECLNEVNGKHRDKIKSLITLNFQVFDDVKEFKKSA